MSNTNDSLKLNGNNITWNILPNQIGYRFPENFMEAFDDVDGIWVQTGTTALIQEGESLLILESGIHSLKKSPEKPVEEKKRGLSALLNRIGENRKSRRAKTSEQAKKKLPALTVSQVRTGRFHIDLTVANIPAEIETTSLRLRAVALVTDVEAFNTQFLIDKNLLTTEDLSAELEKLADGAVRRFVETASFNELNSPNGLLKLESYLLDAWANLKTWGLEIESLQMGSPDNKSEEEFIRAANELKKKEKELEAAVAEAKYMEDLEAFRHSDESKHEVAKIEREKEKLHQSREIEKFRRLHEFEGKFETAKDAQDLQNRLRELKKSGLLSESDFNLYRKALENKERDALHLTEIARIEQQNKIDRLTREYEQQIDKQKAEYERNQNLEEARAEVAAQKIRDDYADSRTEKSEDQLHRKQKNKMEILKQAQDLRNEREENEHRRSMEDKQSERDFELQKEKQRLESFNKMTPEQILAANDKISPQAAEALGKICSSKDNAETVDFLKEVLQKNTSDMQSFLESQMQNQRDFSSAMFRREEIERYLNVIENTTGLPGVKPEQKTSRPDEKSCKNCGKAIQLNANYCPFCGAET